MSARVLVATCGNCLAGDDAFGPLVGRRLRELELPGVKVVDLDLKPAALLDHLPWPDCLILVDAVDAADWPEQELIDIDLSKEELPALLHDDALSSHGLGLADQLELARRLHLLPHKLHFLGAALRAAQIGTAARPQLAQLVQATLERVAELAAQEERAHA
jgi:hydrogenase maturation protease